MNRFAIAGLIVAFIVVLYIAIRAALGRTDEERQDEQTDEVE